MQRTLFYVAISSLTSVMRLRGFLSFAKLLQNLTLLRILSMSIYSMYRRSSPGTRTRTFTYFWVELKFVPLGMFDPVDAATKLPNCMVLSFSITASPELSLKSKHFYLQFKRFNLFFEGYLFSTEFDKLLD